MTIFTTGTIEFISTVTQNRDIILTNKIALKKNPNNIVASISLYDLEKLSYILYNNVGAVTLGLDIPTGKVFPSYDEAVNFLKELITKSL